MHVKKQGIQKVTHTTHAHTTHIFSGRIYKNVGGNDCL